MDQRAHERKATDAPEAPTRTRSGDDSSRGVKWRLSGAGSSRPSRRAQIACRRSENARRFDGRHEHLAHRRGRPLA